MAYRPHTPFNVAMKLLTPTWTTAANSTRKKTYPAPDDVPDDNVFFCSFRTFGGTEVERNGLTVIENTATVETWFRPDIKADCRVVLLQTGDIYDILGTPENIEMRNQFLKFKVRYVGGRP